MIEVPVAHGEFYDKLTILRIKSDKGLDVKTELDYLEARAKELKHGRIVTSFVECLKRVNELLWDIEDDKRAHEGRQDFGDAFTELARLVYILNDHRAHLKREINKYSGSEFTEVKKHSDY
jgi:hypothetical protein